MGIHDPVTRMRGCKALCGARDMRGFGVHGRIGQQLREVDVLIQTFGLQVIAALRRRLVAAFFDDQPAKLFLTTQRQLVIIKTAHKLGQQIIHRDQHAARRFDFALKNILEMLKHHALHGSIVERLIQLRPGRAEAAQMRIALGIVKIRGL